MRVWRHNGTAYTPRNIKATVPYSGGFVMVWGYLSHDDKMDLVTIQGRLTGERYIHDVLEPVVVPHFENHPLATIPVYMDDNARPHRSRAVTAYFQGSAIETLPWPARSPDLNPLEHIWNILGQQIQKMDPPPQTLDELEAALHREWRQLTIHQNRRLTGGMRSRVEAVVIRYWTNMVQILSRNSKWHFYQETVTQNGLI